MPRGNNNDYSKLEDEVVKAIIEGGQIRELVRQLTLQKITEYSHNMDSLRIAVRAITRGALKGIQAECDQAELRSGLARHRVKEIFDGLDDAFAHAALATRLALTEAISHSKTVSVEEFIKLKNDLENFESIFTQTLSMSTSTSKGAVREILHDLMTHSRIHGSVVGIQVREGLNLITYHLGAAGYAKAKAGVHIASVTTDIFRQIMAGALSGLAEHIAPSRQNGKKD